MIPDRILGIRFLLDVTDRRSAQRKSWIIHPRLQAFAKYPIHIFKNLVVFLCADHHIKVRDTLEQLLSARLRHTTHEAVDHVGALLPLLTHDPHFPQRLLLRLITHGAGVDQHRVRILLGLRQRVAALGEHPRHLLGVALVHLATVGLEINFRHQW